MGENMAYTEKIIDGLRLRFSMPSRHIVQVVYPRKWRMKFHYMPSGEIEITGQLVHILRDAKLLEAVKEFGNSHAWEYEEA